MSEQLGKVGIIVSGALHAALLVAIVDRLLAGAEIRRRGRIDPGRDDHPVQFNEIMKGERDAKPAKPVEKPAQPRRSQPAEARAKPRRDPPPPPPRIDIRRRPPGAPRRRPNRRRRWRAKRRPRQPPPPPDAEVDRPQARPTAAAADAARPASPTQSRRQAEARSARQAYRQQAGDRPGRPRSRSPPTSRATRTASSIRTHRQADRPDQAAQCRTGRQRDAARLADPERPAPVAFDVGRDRRLAADAYLSAGSRRRRCRKGRNTSRRSRSRSIPTARFPPSPQLINPPRSRLAAPMPTARCARCCGAIRCKCRLNMRLISSNGEQRPCISIPRSPRLNGAGFISPRRDDREFDPNRRFLRTPTMNFKINVLFRLAAALLALLVAAPIGAKAEGRHISSTRARISNL